MADIQPTNVTTGSLLEAAQFLNKAGEIVADASEKMAHVMQSAHDLSEAHQAEMGDLINQALTMRQNHSDQWARFVDEMRKLMQ